MQNIDRLEENLYRIQVNLPGSPLGSVNSYVLLGKDRHLMVDTGFNMEDCLNVMEGALDELNVDRDRLDIFVTHLHADHSGLADQLAGDNSKIYLNDYGVEVLTADNWDVARVYARKNGFPDDQLDELLANHPGKQFSSETKPNFISLSDGEELQIGSRTLRVVDTPGHTLGHQCLFGVNEKALFAGDHVLGDITPNISVYGEHNRYLLVHYLESLDRVATLGVDVVYPGHREPFGDLDKRVEELKQHHAIRTAEIIDILGSGPANAYDIASQMHWDIPLDSWEEFPLIQRWFATGEALAHLWALEKEEEADVLSENEVTRFKLS